MVNTSGTVVERYAYDAYGKPTVLHGDVDAAGNDTSGSEWSERTSNTFENEMLYCGYRYCPEADYYDVRYRPYHPTLGRWFTADHIMHYWDGMNLYEYSLGDPLLGSDPFGLWKRVKGSIWEAEKEGETLKELVGLVRNDQNKMVLDNYVCIQPRPDNVGGNDANTIRKRMRSLWTRNQAPKCGRYDVGNITGAWPASPQRILARAAVDVNIITRVYGGGAAQARNDFARYLEKMIRAAGHQNERKRQAKLRRARAWGRQHLALEYGAIANLARFYGIGLGGLENVHEWFKHDTPTSLREKIKKLSGLGKTPLKHLTILGHGNERSEGVSFRSGANTISVKTLFGNRIRIRSPYREAVKGEFRSPICWFHAEATVRLTGCSTSNAAKKWETILRKTATAWGTNYTLWIRGPGLTAFERKPNQVDWAHGHRTVASLHSDQDGWTGHKGLR